MTFSSGGRDNFRARGFGALPSAVDVSFVHVWRGLFFDAARSRRGGSVGRKCSQMSPLALKNTVKTMKSGAKGRKVEKEGAYIWRARK